MKRYIKAEAEISSAMHKLIQSIADEWSHDMKEQDCETFKEFVQVNDYDASDIRGEIRYMVQNNYNGWMYDDGSVVIAEDDSEMPYSKFKKAVIEKLNNH